MYILTVNDKDKLLSLLVLAIAVPGILLTGSTLAFLVWVIVFLAMSYPIFMASSMRIKLSLISLLVLMIGLFFPYLVDLIAREFSINSHGSYEALSVVDQLTEKGALFEKLFSKNTRFVLFLSAFDYIWSDPFRLLFGYTRDGFLSVTNGFSPHSFLSESFSLGGVLGGTAFFLFFGVAYYKVRKTIGFGEYFVFMFLIIMVGTINSVNMNVPLLTFFSVILKIKLASAK